MPTARRKIGIIGAGHVGSHAASELIAQNLVEEIVFTDTDKRKAASQALDLEDAVVYNEKRTIVRAGDYSDFKDADILVTAFKSDRHQPSESQRMDSLQIQIEAVKPIIEGIKKSDFSGIIISISNPADIVAHYIQHELSLPREKIFSTGTALDSARLRTELSAVFGYDAKSINAYVIGEHGETQSIPWSWAQIGGKPLQAFIRDNPRKYHSVDLIAIEKNVRERAFTIAGGKKCTEFGIGAALAETVKAVYGDEDRILPVSSLLEGEYGVTGVFASVPTKINRNGASEILSFDLTEKERADFMRSIDFLDEHFQKALLL